MNDRHLRAGSKPKPAGLGQLISTGQVEMGATIAPAPREFPLDDVVAVLLEHGAMQIQGMAGGTTLRFILHLKRD